VTGNMNAHQSEPDALDAEPVYKTAHKENVSGGLAHTMSPLCQFVTHCLFWIVV